MTQESLARRFRPAGFDQPEGSREGYTKPRKELQDAFYRWVDELPEGIIIWADYYPKACEMVEPLGEIPTKEINSLLVGFRPKTQHQRPAGLFISACYVNAPEKVIILDVDASDIDCIGYKAEKNIFNNGSVGNHFADSSLGAVVNNVKCGSRFARFSCGPIVNNGEYADVLFWSSGSFISAEEGPRNYVYRKGEMILKAQDRERIPELKEYLNELSEIIKSVKDEESARKFMEKYGIRGEKIEMEIEEILRRNGFEI